MNCPICNTVCGEKDSFCYRCGAPLKPAPQVKKGSHLAPILILILLSILGTVVFFAVPPKPDTDTSAQMPWFRLSDGYLYFDSASYTGGSELTVPSRFDGELVYGLGEGCFENCTGITTVILPDSLEEIGPSAFSGCTQLRGIYLPDSLWAVGSEAFSGCESLEAIRIPETLFYLESGAFEGCGKLHYIFFDGEYANWQMLYPDYITEDTIVSCPDGLFPHVGSFQTP